MIPHFELVRGKDRFLVFRLGTDFHIIDINEALTRERRFAVLESGCTPAQMQEMGLSGTTIARSDLTAITVTGCGPQDDVIFYLGKKQMSYRFAMAYEQKKVDDFFRGIPRKQYKTRWRFKGGRDLDWRMREQDEARYRKLRPVGWAYNILGPLVCLVPFFLGLTASKLYGWVFIGVTLVAVLLDAILPEYFTIVFLEDRATKRKRRKGGQKLHKTRAINLAYGLVGSVAAFGMAQMEEYHVLEELPLAKIAAICSVVVCVLVIFLCREFLEHPEGGWLFLFNLFFAFALNFAVLIPYFNHIYGPETTSLTLLVTDQYINSDRSGTRYYCKVTMPDGREKSIRVSKVEYDSYELGDMMELQYGEGFFGIEYVIDE